MSGSRVLGRGVALFLALAAVLPAAASAHIQVTPALVAPNDPVKFTVVVPGERSDSTTKVDLKMPADLLPFSYEETPGWKREVIMAANGSVDRVVWTGTIPKDGFVEFSFLAGTPEKAGTLDFKALQTYADGTVVRWIGSPESEHPAPVVQVKDGAPRQNAGGESGGDDTPAATPAEGAATPAPTSAAAQVAAAAPADDDDSPLPLILGAAGLVFGLLALGISIRTARGSSHPAV